MIQLACGGQPRLRESPRQLPRSSRVTQLLAQLLALYTLPKSGAISEAAPLPPTKGLVALAALLPHPMAFSRWSRGDNTRMLGCV